MVTVSDCNRDTVVMQNERHKMVTVSGCHNYSGVEGKGSCYNWLSLYHFFPANRGCFYSLSSSLLDWGHPSFELVQENNISSTQNKFITGALWTGVVLALLAAGTFVVSEVRNLFK